MNEAEFRIVIEAEDDETITRAMLAVESTACAIVNANCWPRHRTSVRIIEVSRVPQRGEESRA